MSHIFDYKLFLLVFALSASGFILQAEVYTPQNYSLIPPSPEVAKLLEYNEIPVDYAHGIPDISYTLDTLKEGNLEVPIRVAYHGYGKFVCL